MAELIPIAPVSKMAGPVELIVTMAAIDDHGLVFGYRAMNGHMLATGVVRADDAAAVDAEVARIAAASDGQVTTPIVLDAWRELYLPAEGNYRQALKDQRFKRRGADDDMGQEPQPWPDPINARAFHGVVGEIAKAITPHTEADPVALLVTLLVFFGNALGHAPHARVSGGRHTTNEFVVIMGPTAKGRKGSSIGHPRMFMDRVDPEWNEHRVLSGLSSGEGLVANVRDPAVSKDGTVIDAGETDKRLMVVEEEFAAVLKVMIRENNTLSTFLRQAWDTGTLGVMTRASPLRAHDAHISILGHATKHDLLRYLAEEDAWNGFANRFLWICSTRSQNRLPRGDTIPHFGDLVPRARAALEWGRTVTAPVRWGDEAGALWDKLYEPLTRERAGRLAAVTGRGEAHVLRLAVLYAVLDLCDEIGLEHLQAALAVWHYAEQSARWLFGDDGVSEEATTILDALASAGEAGMNTRGLYAAFDGKIKRERLQTALDQLLTGKRILQRKGEPSEKGGRPGYVYVLNPKGTTNG